MALPLFNKDEDNQSLYLSSLSFTTRANSLWEKAPNLFNLFTSNVILIFVRSKFFVQKYTRGTNRYDSDQLDTVERRSTKGEKREGKFRQQRGRCLSLKRSNRLRTTTVHFSICHPGHTSPWLYPKPHSPFRRPFGRTPLRFGFIRPFRSAIGCSFTRGRLVKVA